MLVVAHHRVGVRCFGLETNFFVSFWSQIGRFFTFLKKKRNHISRLKKKNQTNDTRMSSSSSSAATTAYTWGEDESAEKAEGRDSLWDLIVNSDDICFKQFFRD